MARRESIKPTGPQPTVQVSQVTGLSHGRPPIPAFLGTFPLAGLACGKVLEEIRINA
jgi:hypothetical protein